MIEYMLTMINSMQSLASRIKHASSESNISEILEILSDSSVINRIIMIIVVFILGPLFMVFKQSFLDWWEKTKMLLFTLAKETFLILLRRGLYSELEKIKVEMESNLHDKLKNADTFADKHDDTISNEEKDKAKKSVGKLVDIIYNFEAVYDRYQLLQETPEYSSNTWCCWVFILKMLWVLKLNLLILIRKISIAFSVAKVNQELVELEKSDSYHQVEVEDDSRQQYQWQPMPPPPPEYELVGLQCIKAELIEMLKVGNKRQFIVVTGEAGIGKTTLVEKVYLDYDVTSYFQLRAFVTVSKIYNQKHILKAIFDQLKADDEPSVSTSLSVTEIVARIRNYLQNSEKSYIIVLDDVWGDDDEFSDCINKAFPYNEKGSGILMTIRGREPDVAGHWTSKLHGIAYHVYPLSDSDARLLFCKKAFRSDNGECPPALKCLLPSILQKCENNPLLIGVVAGILARKEKTVSKWQTAIDDFSIEFRADSAYQRIKKILLYSYHDLSYELQQCFLYFGMFPEDSQIYIDTLVHIWVAEGFIRRSRRGTNHTLEEIAENHLNELIRRGLVILGYKEKKSSFAMTELRENFVRVHDVFHEIILQKLEDLEFCQVLSKASSSEILNKPFRRLSMDNTGGTNLNLDRINTGTVLNWDKSILGNSWIVRSVLSFKNETFPNFPKTSIVCLLRILLLEHYQKDDFPEVVSSMCNLRFLSLTHHKIEKIPEFICKLLNLETLEIKHSSYCQLPKEMSMLKKLRHLLLSIEVRIPEGVLRSLTSLQTLDEIEGKLEYILEEIKLLTQLRRLAIVYVDKKYDQQFSEALQEMPELRFLSMCWSNMSPRRDRDSYHNRSPPKKLESIVLWGDIGRDSLSGWIKKVKELRSLSLHLTRSVKWMNIKDTKKTTEELIAALKPLEKLEHLYLRTEGIKQLDFGSDGFEGLQYLMIRDFDLESIKGSLPSLLELDLRVKYQKTKLNLPDHLEKIAVIRCFDVKGNDDVVLQTQHSVSEHE